MSGSDSTVLRFVPKRSVPPEAGPAADPGHAPNPWRIAWELDDVLELFALPIGELLDRARMLERNRRELHASGASAGPTPDVAPSPAAGSAESAAGRAMHHEWRALRLLELASANPPAAEVDIDALMPSSADPVEPLAGADDPADLVRTIAVARVLLPRAALRLGAPRREFDPDLLALCHSAGIGCVEVAGRAVDPALLGADDRPRDARAG